MTGDQLPFALSGELEGVSLVSSTKIIKLNRDAIRDNYFIYFVVVYIGWPVLIIILMSYGRPPMILLIKQN